MYLNSSKALLLAATVSLLSACASQQKVTEITPVAVTTSPAAVVPAGPSAPEMAAYEAAVQALEAGDLIAAKSVLLDLAKKYPEFAGPVVNLAILAEKDGDMDGAIAQYQVALAIKPDHVAALNNLAVLLQQRGEFARAAEFYQRGLKKAPESPELNYNLAVLCELYLQDYSKAIKYYEAYNSVLAQPDADVDVLLKGLKRRVN